MQHYLQQREGDQQVHWQRMTDKAVMRRWLSPSTFNHEYATREYHEWYRAHNNSGQYLYAIIRRREKVQPLPKYYQSDFVLSSAPGTNN